jgi:hypothetical protein
MSVLHSDIVTNIGSTFPINGYHKGSKASLARIQYNIKVSLMYDISKCNKIRGLGGAWPVTRYTLSKCHGRAEVREWECVCWSQLVNNGSPSDNFTDQQTAQHYSNQQTKSDSVLFALYRLSQSLLLYIGITILVENN